MQSLFCLFREENLFGRCFHQARRQAESLLADAQPGIKAIPLHLPLPLYSWFFPAIPRHSALQQKPCRAGGILRPDRNDSSEFARIIIEVPSFFQVTQPLREILSGINGAERIMREQQRPDLSRRAPERGGNRRACNAGRGGAVQGGGVGRQTALVSAASVIITEIPHKRNPFVTQL